MNDDTKLQGDLREGLINRESASTLRSSIEPETQNPAETPKVRLKSIDIYRGLTMFGMILVDNQGGHPIWPLDETDWNGISTADLIFPAFLFIMGFAVPLAVRKPFKPLRTLLRVAGLFLIGFLLNLTSHKFDFTTVRILGVLQRISICYIVLVGIHCITGYAEKSLRKYGAMLVVLLSALYMGLMVNFEDDGTDGLMTCNRLNNLSKLCNFTRWLDMKVLHYEHMLKPTDPEGIFSTLSSLMTAYGGYWFCLVMRDCKNDKKEIVKQWLSWAIFFVLLSLPMSLIMPYNKKLWTSSFAFLTVGICGTMLVVMLGLIDVAGQQGSRFSKCIDICTRPFLWLGMNPLAIFVLMDLTAVLMIRIIFVNDGKESSWHAFYRVAFSSWISDPYLCSTVFSLFFALVWTIVAFILFRFKIFIKL